MPQQINLCTPILLTQKRYFSAQTMVQALGVFVLLGSGLCAYWVASLNTASDGFSKALAAQSRELESLRVALVQRQGSAGPADAALMQELQARRSELTQREGILEELRRGLIHPGAGHAARLRLLAESIPRQVWVTEVRADESRLDVSGFTLEPAALNDWVAKLRVSPLLEGQPLSTVKVANVNAPAGEAVNAPAGPKWTFTLVSTVAGPGTLGGSAR